MAVRRWRQAPNRLQPWEVAPDDWGHFARNGAVSVLTVGAIVILLRLLVDDLGTRRAIGFGLVGLAFGQAYLWTFSVLAWRELNRERSRWGMPTRPVPALALLAVPAVVGALAFTGFSLRESGAWWSSDNLITTIPAVMGTLGGTLIAALFLGRRALRSPANRAMLDREWYLLHGSVGPDGQPGQ